MLDSDPGEITRLLEEMKEGKSGSESRLMEAVYPELKRIAARHLRNERSGHTLQTTALANEAYLKLLGKAEIDWRNRGHFFAAAAQAIRRILVDYGRMRRAARREGGRSKIELTEGLAISEDRLEEVIAIDEALTRQAEWDLRQCRVVEMKFFGGLTETEIADVLKISKRTVIRDWNVARAWLHGELDRATRSSL